MSGISNRKNVVAIDASAEAKKTKASVTPIAEPAPKPKRVRKPKAVAAPATDNLVTPYDAGVLVAAIESMEPETSIYDAPSKIADCIPTVEPTLWDSNKALLRSINASDAQVVALHKRTFSALPLWVRKRLKRQFRSRYSNPTSAWTELRSVKPYFLRHVGKEELARLREQHPAASRQPLFQREPETARLMFGHQSVTV